MKISTLFVNIFIKIILAPLWLGAFVYYSLVAMSKEKITLKFIGMWFVTLFENIAQYFKKKILAFAKYLELV